jgi:hypothetical protein
VGTYKCLESIPSAPSSRSVVRQFRHPERSEGSRFLHLPANTQIPRFARNDKVADQRDHLRPSVANVRCALFCTYEILSRKLLSNLATSAGCSQGE